jgi:hypothetical protein
VFVYAIRGFKNKNRQSATTRIAGEPNTQLKIKAA